MTNFQQPMYDIIENNLAALVADIEKVEEAAFFQPQGEQNEKWSIAENVVHLEMSVRPLKLVFGLPRLVLWWRFGKANRPSRTAAELKARYEARLLEAKGLPTPDGFAPKIKADFDKKTIIARCIAQHKAALNLAKAYPESALDAYVVPHPLLGKITLRELIHFTGFHIKTHHDIILRTYAFIGLAPNATT
jgi:hypothetical protein